MGDAHLIYLPFCQWELDFDSRNWEKDLSPWDEMLYETSIYFLQRSCDERRGLQQNPECNRSAWRTPNHGKETETKMVWPHLKILWHSEDNSAGDSERSKKERKQKTRWEYNIKEWTWMGFGDSLRAAEDREGWKDIAATSSWYPDDRQG